MYAGDGRIDGQHPGHAGRELALLPGGQLAGRARRLVRRGPARLGARRIPDGGGGQLGRGQHPGAPVLDRLELPDRPAELLADLGVLGSGLHGPVGHAAGLGPEQDRRQAGHRGAVEPGEQPVRGHGDARRAHPGHRAGEVETVQRGDLQDAGVDRGPDLAVAGAHWQDHQVGHAGAEHGGRLAVDDQAAVGRDGAAQAVGQADRAGLGPVGQADEQLAGDARGGEDRAGQHGGQRRAWHQGAAEFLQRHGELGKAEALAAVFFRQVQAEHALLGQARPE